jgi:hypothetical protein
MARAVARSARKSVREKAPMQSRMPFGEATEAGDAAGEGVGAGFELHLRRGFAFDARFGFETIFSPAKSSMATL